MTESLNHSKAVIDLGKRLVSELRLEDDFIAQWMAHVIAERIDAAENAPPETRALAQDTCSRAIFDLWKHRNCLPAHIRPFRELEPLLQTLASLDVDGGGRFRYFRRQPSDEEAEAVKTEESLLLQTAVNLDYSARALIQYLLGIAAKDASSKARPWLQTAIDADADVALELRIVQLVSQGENAPGAEQLARKSLQEKIERLEAFAQLASDVALELRQQLECVGTRDGNA